MGELIILGHKCTDIYRDLIGCDVAQRPMALSSSLRCKWMHISKFLVYKCGFVCLRFVVRLPIFFFPSTTLNHLPVRQKRQSCLLKKKTITTKKNEFSLGEFQTNASYKHQNSLYWEAWEECLSWLPGLLFLYLANTHAHMHTIPACFLLSQRKAICHTAIMGHKGNRVW